MHDRQVLSVDGATAEGWALEPQATAPPEPEYIREGMARIVGSPITGRRVSRSVPAPTGTQLIVSAEVRSDCRVIGYAGKSRMSYHTIGEWQTLTGFARVNETGELPVAFLVSPFGQNQTPSAEIRNLRVVKFDRPDAIRRRPASASTALVSGGKAAAVIVYPSGSRDGREWGDRIAAAIQPRAGVELPVISDIEATKPDVPAIRDDLRDKHLILIGRLGTNRAIWSSYARWLESVDGYYPGGDGYVVRTAVNVFRNGKNHVIVGGSNENGVARAVDELINLIGDAPVASTGLELPFAMKIELGGDCLKNFKEYDTVWAADPLDRSLPPVEPGYGSVRRWYENAIAWYFSGWESYRERSDEMLTVVLEDQAYTHHYIAEFLVRTCDMVDETGLLTDKQREQLDSLILDNFLDFATEAGDGQWMTTFTPPYDAIEMMNRHQISPWVADLTMANFLHTGFDLPDNLKSLAAFRESEKLEFFRDVLANRSETSLPGGLAETPEEFSLAMMRIALEHEQYAFFENGHAARSLNIEKINPLTGSWVRPGGGVDSRLILSTLASYHRDGRYLWLSRRLKGGVPFMNRTVNGVHRFVPGEELREQAPSSLAGFKVAQMSPHRQSQLSSLQSKQFAPVQFAPSAVFDFASYRSGFDAGDDYIAINGILGQAVPGTFLSFRSKGVEWLPGATREVTLGGTDSYFHHNAAHVLRTDKWLQSGAPHSAAAKLDWKAELPEGGGVAFTLSPHSGTSWQRTVVCVRAGLYVVRDRVTALESGDYQICINWRPAGQASWDRGAWLSQAAGSALRITPMSDHLQISQNIDLHHKGIDADAHLRFARTGRLEPNSPVSATTVLQATESTSPSSLAAFPIENGVILQSAAANQPEAVVLFGPIDGPTLKSDAQGLIIFKNEIKVLVGSQIILAGKSLLQSGNAVSRSLELSTEQSTELMNELVNGRKPLPSVAAETAGDVLPLIAAERKWTTDQLAQPLPVTPARTLPNGVLDLGREVLIEEIRAKRIGGAWKPLPLPTDIQYAAGKHGAPPSDSADWKSFDGKPLWQSGAVTGNYGRSEPVSEEYQVWKPTPVRARYVRSMNSERLTVGDAENRGRQIPLTLKVADLDGDDQPELIVHTTPWPKFLRRVFCVNDTLAVFSAEGELRFREDFEPRLQVAELVQLGGKAPTLLLATHDGVIRQLNPDGSTRWKAELSKLHAGFQETFGRPNTRHPAGGFTMPFSVGPWRPDGSEPGFVVGRYNCFGFLTADGRLDGVLTDGSYVQPAMLNSGVDFDGDGHEEQVCLARGVLFRLHGPRDSRITEPTGTKFFPQVYHAEKLAEPAWEDRLDGSAPLILKKLHAGSSEGRARYVLAARDNYIGIYDGQEHQWAFAWVPLVPIRAATVVVDSADHLRLAAVTEDQILYELSFAGVDLTALESFKTTTIPMPVQSICGWTDSLRRNVLVFGGSLGLHLRDQAGDLKQIAPGKFVDVKLIGKPGVTGTLSLAAVAEDGSLSRFDLEAERNK